MTEPATDRTTGTRVPLSVLDLALVADGSTGAAAIQRAVALAIDLDALGYRRVWYAEHHLAPGVASAAPAVLAAAVAARTSRIRVGSGAVLLSTTSPLIAAEQFGTIAALHPGRVDLGLGRAFTVPPSAGAPRATDTAAPEGDERRNGRVKEAQNPTRPTFDGGRAAAGGVPRLVDGLYVPPAPPNGFNDPALRERLLAQQEVIGAQRTPADFREEVELVLDVQRGTYRDRSGAAYTSPPVEGAQLDLWLLASSGGESARVAGELGLPLAANFHVSPATVLDTVAAYREAFRPGVLEEPYVIVSADVLVAQTLERARVLAEPFADWVLSIRRGERGAIAYPSPSAATAWTDRPDAERALVADRVDTRIVGDPDTVVERLETLVRVTGADELLVTTATHDPAETRRSFELLAQAWGTGDPVGDPARPARTAAAQEVGA
ncbi:LLM class flavin-dependent oxidoreductase [Promicromonospora sukumoe]|uniref:Alkanesulfonate monooxygenase SsuD/methylene tetrahydromethanopterin reductase-like flavin-dependent oxidoreductase (Luciferase family) n=1 Tax=Promicromonospora sukumoe TaxID=88382 RepID=A0A7W3PE29_9MICO|nr:LLM class flavin-dependent oxidoreductase [Promicromonospora sukumoe]MBA8808620.1 alkanesulfonate monooxygenase SsuD/methylene tetrahydromethanopterin reductase-like flavin-dependent oxidoreductase (luciferase family) [Promicromonospora sukumoe]